MRLKSLFFLFFLIGALGFTQAPEKFTYQSVIKNSSGYLLKNQEIGLRISILFNSSNGMSVYSEEHTVESNSNGLVTLIIGEGVTSDVFNDIDWGSGEYYLKVEVDPNGGINYTMNQTSQLLSVPYALYAGNSNTKLNLLGQDYISLNNQTLTINKIDLNDDVDGILSVNNGGTGTSTAPMIGVITAADAPAARLALGLGTAAITASGDYATAAQGALADTALQDATAFATAAQGVTADAALPAANVSTFGATLIDDADAATARATLELGTAATTNALAFGIADTNVIKVDDTDAADDDFAKFTANGIEGRDASEMRTDLGLVIGVNVLAEQTIGIADDNLIEVDDTDAVDDDFAKFTANGIEGRDASEMRTDLGLVVGVNVLAQQTIGIADDNLMEVDDTDAADDDFAKFTANGIEGRDASEMRTDLGLVIGTNVQAFDPRLADLSGISAADGTIIVGNGSNLISETSTTARNSLGIISGIITMDAVTSITETVAGITANSHVVVSFKSGKNGRQIVSVVPGTNSITINLSGDSSSDAKVMFIAIQ